jgi:hypothetical protein
MTSPFPRKFKDLVTSRTPVRRMAELFFDSSGCQSALAQDGTGTIESGLRSSLGCENPLLLLRVHFVI